MQTATLGIFYNFTVNCPHGTSGATVRRLASHHDRHSPSMDVPVLYYDARSPPVRSVLLTLAALGAQDKVKLELVDLFAGMHLQERFVKLNPLHTVPVLAHGSLILTDSHAILPYLCDVFGAGTDLALDEPGLRAQVFNRLCYNNSVLFQRDSQVMRKIFREPDVNLVEELPPVEEAFDYLEAYLKQSKYVAGDRLTVADLSIVATVSTMDIIMPVTEKRWPRISEWYREMQSLQYYRANQVGLDELKKLVLARLKQ